MKRYALVPHRSFWFAAGLGAATGSVGLLGGLGLSASEQSLVRLTPLLIALPAMYAVAGNYAMIIAAHLSDPQAYASRRRTLVKALAIAVPVSITGVSVISLVIAFLENYPLTIDVILRYVIFYTITLLGVVAVIFLSTMLATKILRVRHINSDDVLVSVMNNLASVLTLAAIALAAVFYF
jgi:cation transporter-like permease